MADAPAADVRWFNKKCPNPACEKMNHARRNSCIECGTKLPVKEKRPGLNARIDETASASPAPDRAPEPTGPTASKHLLSEDTLRDLARRRSAAANAAAKAAAAPPAQAVGDVADLGQDPVPNVAPVHTAPAPAPRQRRIGYIPIRDFSAPVNGVLTEFVQGRVLRSNAIGEILLAQRCPLMVVDLDELIICPHCAKAFTSPPRAAQAA